MGDIEMALFRCIQVNFWQDAFVLDLTPEEKYFYMYLMTNSKTTQCGIYELPIKVIEMETGYNREIVGKLLRRFTEYGKILYSIETKEIMLINWLKYNYVNSPKVKSYMIKELLKVKNKEFIKKLIEVIKAQNITEDTQWIPYTYTIDTISTPNRYPIDTVSIDYGEEREREEEIEEEIEVEVEREREKEKKLMCHSLSLIKYIENSTGEVGVVYMPYRDIITKLKQNILDEEFYQRTISKYQSCELLLIDDLFKGKITESDINIIFEILNYRYLNHLPIIISTEFLIDELLDLGFMKCARVIWWRLKGVGKGTLG
jgi:hypothetical protein